MANISKPPVKFPPNRTRKKSTFSSIQHIANEQIATTKQVYLLSPERMFSEYTGEKANVENYNGRQLLEMLQNADDAALLAKGDRKVKLALRGTRLIIANTGHKFSEEGLKSIFHSHLSPKEAQDNQIGKKGLGFRSILSWAEKVTINSHDLKASFSREYSISVLQDLLKDEKFHIAYQRLKKSEKYPISTLVCPNVDDCEIDDIESFAEYDTVIQVDLKLEALAKLKKQIVEDLDGEVLLFLNNLSKIEVDIDGEITTFSKEVSENLIEISLTSDLGKETRQWRIHSKTGRFKDLDRPFSLAIAWNNELLHSKNVIYSYFRTKVPFESAGIIHGSFELNSDRNLIIDDSYRYNQKLVLLLPGLLAEAAELMAGEDESSPGYRPLALSQVDFESFSHLQDSDKLSELLVTEMKVRKVFPLISGRYTTWGNGETPVYYENPVFSELLPPNDFPFLMPECAVETIEVLLKKLGRPWFYPAESIINYISKNRKAYSVRNYARLVYVLKDHIGEFKSIENLFLFYDEKEELLSFSDVIFLPPQNFKYKFPDEVKVQVIHHELAQELCRQNAGNYDQLTEDLECYNLREYNESEVIEKLIEYYTAELSVESIRKLHTHLFRLYLLKKDRSERWEGSEILLVSKNNNLRKASDLYFGRDYGYEFNEKIYHYDKAKIVASSKSFGIEAHELKDFVEYLSWLNVQHRPKRVTVNNDTGYAEYCMKVYNYKNRIDDYVLKTYSDFRALTPQFKGFSATSIDDLHQILLHNSSEDVLRLIDSHETLSKAIEKNFESEQSYVAFKLGSDRNPRSIRGRTMYPYIKWKIQSMPWLGTESGVKTSPDKCATAAYIDKNFYGLIERPLLNYNVLTRAGLSKDKSDHLLIQCGVHKGIDSFSMEAVLSILMRLPTLEDGNKKARLIYNQLAVNYDRTLASWDTRDPLYVSFQEKGEVLCKCGNFYPVKNSFYVNDKRFGESILKYFNLIDIDRRRGMDKIRKIFCVPPLLNLSLTLKEPPVAHPLNASFEKELEAFKPFVYALRKDVDAGQERNVIKTAQFKLVSKLTVELEKEGGELVFDLEEYEYFTMPSRNTIYIKTPGLPDSVEDLKEDIRFCSVVAEAFSSLLDVEAQRQQIRELFSKTNFAREELLRTELDDTNLEKLNNARSLLGVMINPKKDFWQAFVSCFKKKKLNLKQETDEELLSKLGDLFPGYFSAINPVFNQINYSDPNEEESAELIVDLFRHCKIRLADFNQFCHPQIDVRKNFEMKAKRELFGKQDIFKSNLYELSKKQEDLKPRFSELVFEYQNFQLPVNNEVNFNPIAKLHELILQRFAIDVTKAGKVYNWAEINQTHREKLWLNLKGKVADSSLVDQYIDSDPVAQSLLWFEDKLEVVAEKFLKWLGTAAEKDGGVDGTRRAKLINLGNKSVLYDSLSDLRKEIDQIVDLNWLSGITSTPLEIEGGEGGTGAGNNNSRPKPRSAPPQRQSPELGFIGEYIVYNHLLRTVKNKESVKWVSQNAKDCGVNLDGVDGLGYDIVYIPNNSPYPRYIEVKVVGWKDSFHISSNEVKFGEEMKKHYDIYLVRDAATLSNARIEIIKGMFDYKGDSFNSNNRFTVVNDNYIIRFKPKIKK